VVSREELLKVVSIAMGLKGRNGRPLAIIDVAKGVLTFTYCNGVGPLSNGVNWRTVLQDGFTTPFSVEFQLDYLAAFLRSETSEQVRLSTVDNILTIEGTGTMKVFGSTPEDIPVLINGTTRGFDLPSDSAAKLLKVLPRFVGKDKDHRPTLCGIQIEPHPDATDRVRAIATDTHRLCVVDLPVDGFFVEKYWLPAPLLKPLHALRGSDSIRLYLDLEDKSVAVLTSGTINVWAQVATGNYPSWEKVVPSSNTKQFTCDRAELLATCKKFLRIGKESANRMRMTITPRDGLSLTSSCEVAELRAEVRAAAKGVGDSFEIAFNVRYLIDALSVLTGNIAFFEMTEASRAVVVKDEQNTTQIVVMPMTIH